MDVIRNAKTCAEEGKVGLTVNEKDGIRRSQKEEMRSKHYTLTCF